MCLIDVDRHCIMQDRMSENYPKTTRRVQVMHRNKNFIELVLNLQIA